MLSVVIPVYNEAEVMRTNVITLLSFLNRLGESYEVLLCSNGSTDSTPEIGQRLMEELEGVRFFHIPRRGAGLAFKKLVREAKYEYITSLDMDLAVDLSFIPRCCELLKGYDIVVGSKRVGQERRPFLRKVLNRGFTALTNALLNLGFSDYSMGAKGFRKSKIERYLPRLDDGSFYIVQLLYHASSDGLKVVEIPVNWTDFRRSKFDLGRESFYRLTKLLSLSLQKLGL